MEITAAGKSWPEMFMNRQNATTAAKPRILVVEDESIIALDIINIPGQTG